MTHDVQRDPEKTISRRTLVHGLAAAAGATVIGTSGALSQQASQVGPPTTITTPPRDFGPDGAPTTYFWDPDIIAVDPSFNDSRPTQLGDQTPLYRDVVGRGSGVELAGPLSGVERPPQ